jgi:hypothetical protein
MTNYPRKQENHMNVQRGDDVGGVYFDADTSDKGCDRYTVYCALPDSPRGFYDEEIDVDANGPTHARQVAEGAIEMDYDPRLAPKRTEKRPAGMWYM